MHADRTEAHPRWPVCELGGRQLDLASNLIPPRQNSKSEARNPKQCQMSQIENSKRASLQALHFRDLEIRILDLFRISKFELRISKGKVDHFVRREQVDLGFSKTGPSERWRGQPSHARAREFIMQAGGFQIEEPPDE